MLFKGFIIFCFGLFFKLVDFKSNANTEGEVVEDNAGNQKLGQCKLWKDKPKVCLQLGSLILKDKF